VLARGRFAVVMIRDPISVTVTVSAHRHFSVASLCVSRTPAEVMARGRGRP
jgi:hypothetical protein